MVESLRAVNAGTIRTALADIPQNETWELRVEGFRTVGKKSGVLCIASGGVALRRLCGLVLAVD